MDLLIVGAGAMGRWFGRTVDADLAFADADPERATAAADDLGGRAVPLDGDEQFDVVCLAVPMRLAAEAVDANAHRATDVMCDVTGSMAAPVAAMREHFDGHERLSLHPLFAPQNGPGNVAAVVDESGPLTDAILADLDSAGNHVFETTPEEHDRAMETVQAATHAAVLSFGLAADNVRDEFATPVSAALDELVASVSGGTPRVYADIQSSFGDGTDRVADAARALAMADPETFADLYRTVARSDTSKDGNEHETDKHDPVE
ncbi:prephenate dehydrogenase [Haloferax mediterranei ATCC 33500]|uniref:Prephenate dehydrogenase n=1 Tax=Haloferax mediterranei (strain ATCC 33500 / DSM 1411 / JCM 8866 / NBRC 14739 / NCIMB 2177 / R-4) TaxID=523841 RepID=I3R4D2_HALMT|nr:prephenate dehydrogenase/arogenate dehydrogenase family protein [Haloferax mediterranei]AFK19092.1 prephenate dehydrogenase [Haloferax mediterranei ATCC 33500]AHZ21548.1 prephenate dehydrogenase [Haloferax mediterranei ATCC 33500]EMA04009.1 prephenate dehydrogenase [Haloferax mediterranei ATCC 33500]MDX5989184.1 prephenate dehydrogenase/arogenate dehydrogenase family protein [Haloferax mediterranei ATCC 33500]QCQ75565.1 prephenate dehydrogenase [Haloferax mediterranei ATCC 33500]